MGLEAVGQGRRNVVSRQLRGEAKQMGDVVLKNMTLSRSLPFDCTAGCHLMRFVDGLAKCRYPAGCLPGGT